MASGWSAERVGEDMVEYLSLDRGGVPDLVKLVGESRQSQGGHGGMHPDVRERGETARLASSTKAHVRRFKPGHRRRIVNAVLGAAIFATVSVAALATLNAPDSYIFASGSAALAAIILVREARSHA